MANDRAALDALRKVSRMEAVHPVKHFLYLPTKRAAANVATYLRSSDILVEEPFETYDSWLVRVRTHIMPTESNIAEIRSLLERTAKENGGEYDGWEAEVQS